MPFHPTLFADDIPDHDDFCESWRAENIARKCRLEFGRQEWGSFYSHVDSPERQYEVSPGIRSRSSYPSVVQIHLGSVFFKHELQLVSKSQKGQENFSMKVGIAVFIDPERCCTAGRLSSFHFLPRSHAPPRNSSQLLLPSET